MSLTIQFCPYCDAAVSGFGRPRRHLPGEVWLDDFVWEIEKFLTDPEWASRQREAAQNDHNRDCPAPIGQVAATRPLYRLTADGSLEETGEVRHIPRCW